FLPLYLMCFFFFLLLRRLRISPLFPYTTLFRSDFCLRRPANDRCTTIALRGLPNGPAGQWRRRKHYGGDRRVDRMRAARRDESRDRKSTRLNSSHGSISYAVFCLKKKKINKDIP